MREGSLPIIPERLQAAVASLKETLSANAASVSFNIKSPPLFSGGRICYQVLVPDAGRLVG